MNFHGYEQFMKNNKIDKNYQMKRSSEDLSEEYDEFNADDKDEPNILGLVHQYSEKHRKRLLKKDTPSFNRNLSDANKNNEDLNAKQKEEEKRNSSPLKQDASKHEIDDVESEEGQISEDDVHIEKVTENNLKNTK